MCGKNPEENGMAHGFKELTGQHLFVKYSAQPYMRKTIAVAA